MMSTNQDVTAQRENPAKHSIFDMGRPICNALRKALVQAYDSAVGQGRKNSIVKMFDGIVAKQTVLDILKKYEEQGHFIPGKNSGRPPKLASSSNVKRIQQLVDHKDNVSDAMVARRIGWSRSYVQKVRATTLNIKKYKKRRAPFYKRGEDKEVSRKCRKLLRQTVPPGSDDLIVMDDEHYIFLEKTKSTSSMFYSSSDRSETPLEAQVLPHRKFCPKLMIWQAISMQGRSQLYIVPSRQNVNKDVYLNQCLKKRLLPFLRQAYPTGNAIFWPDKASSHYARTVIEFLRSENVHFVEKDVNPTCVPQARPIERYWSEIDRRLSAYKNDAPTLELLARRVRKVVKDIPDSYVQTIMATVRSKLRRISDSGVYSVQ
jgi:transposase